MTVDETVDNQTGSETNANNPAGQGDLAGKSPEDLASIIAGLRKENAAKRVRNREDEQKLAEFEEWKASQLTETEKLKADLEKSRSDRLNDWAEMYCEKYGVPDDSRDLVRGESKETIERLAKALGKPQEEAKEERPSQPNPNPNLFPGARGSAVGSTGKNGNDFDVLLRSQLMG